MADISVSYFTICPTVLTVNMFISGNILQEGAFATLSVNYTGTLDQHSAVTGSIDISTTPGSGIS